MVPDDDNFGLSWKQLRKCLAENKTPKGGDRRPTFILGDFVEAFVGERSPFEEGAM